MSMRGMDRKLQSIFDYFIYLFIPLKAAVKATAVQRGFFTYDVVIINCNILIIAL